MTQNKVAKKVEERMKKWKILIIVGLTVVATLMVVGAVWVKSYQNAEAKFQNEIKRLEEELERRADPVAAYEDADKEVDISVIKSGIKEIGELATIEYLYTDAGKFENTKQFIKWDVPFTEKSFIAKWDGVIKAGILVDKIDVEVNKISKIITISLPAAQILSHEIDTESVETLDEKDGLFNPVRVEDVRQFDAISKDTMEKRAIENGLLDKASENAKSIIKKYVMGISGVAGKYTVEFKNT